MTPSIAPDPRFRAWLVERSPRTAPPDLLERTVRAATARSQAGRWTGRWPILRFAGPAAAALGSLTVVGAALLLLPPSTPVVDSASPAAVTSPVVTQLPSPRPSSTASPIPTATSIPPPPTAAASTPAPATVYAEWTRVDLPDPAPDHLGGATTVAVVHAGDQYVVVGHLAVASTFGDRPPTVTWTSTDGRSWELHERVEGLEAAARFSDLVVVDGRMLALGTAVDGAPPEPGAWISSDGSSWLRVAGTAPSIVAVGRSELIGALRSGPGTTLLRSPDGSDWEAASDFIRADIIALGVDPSGDAVALGHVTVESTTDDSYATHIAAWRDFGGAGWDEGSIVARNSVARAVVAGPDGFVVVGHETVDRPDGSVLDSARIWRLTTSTGLVPIPIELGPGQTLDHIFRIGDDLVATGSEPTDRGDAIIVLHSSDGGDSWTRVPAQPALEGSVTSIVDVAAGPSGLLAVGNRLDPASGHLVPVAWLAEP